MKTTHSPLKSPAQVRAKGESVVRYPFKLKALTIFPFVNNAFGNRARTLVLMSFALFRFDLHSPQTLCYFAATMRNFPPSGRGGTFLITPRVNSRPDFII